VSDNCSLLNSSQNRVEWMLLSVGSDYGQCVEQLTAGSCINHVDSQQRMLVGQSS